MSVGSHLVEHVLVSRMLGEGRKWSFRNSASGLEGSNRPLGFRARQGSQELVCPRRTGSAVEESVGEPPWGWECGPVAQYMPPYMPGVGALGSILSTTKFPKGADTACPVPLRLASH